MRLVFPGTKSEELSAWLHGHPEGHERAAIVYCRKFADYSAEFAQSNRFVVIGWRALSTDEILSSSSTRLEYTLRFLPPDFLKCESEGLTFCFAHSHPVGELKFSEQDEKNEQVLLRALRNYSNDGKAELVAILWARGRWTARYRASPHLAQSEASQHVLVHKYRTLAHFEVSPDIGGWNSRQAAAFGRPFNDLLSRLRIGIVGLGGTGSPLAHAAARSGVGMLVLVDGDKIDFSNLNRTTGYAKEDVGKPKALVTKKRISEIGLGTKIEVFDKYLHKCGEAIDALSCCDFVFGCTDDVIGRDILNQAAYYYCNPFIDVGLAGRLEGVGSDNPFLAEHRARISTIMPESGACLRCQRVVTDDKLRYQQEVNRRPELAEIDAETLRREHYLAGGGEAAPGVGPFTTSAAQFAFMSFMELLKPFRKYPEDILRDNVWIDFLNLHFYSNDYSGNAGCFVCGSEGLLNAPERGNRLGMPALGKTLRS